MTETEIKNPGQELRATRERLGLSLQDVALATKINARILKALEEGDRDALPAKSFARGFIRSYAAYLKIDAEPILAAYGAMRTDSGRARFADEPDTASTNEAGVVHESRPQENKPQAISKSSMNERSLASRIMIFAAIFILVGLVIFVKKLKDKYEREKTTPTVTTTLPHGVLAPPVETVTRNGQANTQSLHSTPQKPLTTQKPLAAQKPLITQKQPPAPIKSTQKPTTKTSVNTNAKSTTNISTRQKIVPVKPPQPTLQLIIEALDNVTVTLQVGKTPPQTIQLVPQAVHTIKTNERVVISATDGGMIDIIKNGHDLGVPGQLGKPITLRYP